MKTRGIIVSFLLIISSLVWSCTQQEPVSERQPFIVEINMPDGENPDADYVNLYAGEKIILTETAYNQGHFTLVFPEAVRQEHLVNIKTLTESSDIYYTISDTDAQVLASPAGIKAFKDSQDAGKIIYMAVPTDGKEVSAMLFYTDRDVSVTSEYASPFESISTALFLKKGWNWVYTTEIIREDGYRIHTTSTYTSDPLEWHYLPAGN